jgi:tetratricopeptide (TPR) repeat protein
LSSGNTYYELASEFLIPWIQKRQRQFRRFARIVWAYVFCGLVVLLLLMGHYAKKAVEARRAANELIAFMQYELRDILDEGANLDLKMAVNDRIEKFQEEYPPPRGDLAALREKSVTLGRRGELLMEKNEPEKALASFRESLSIAEQLIKHDPDNLLWLRDVALSHERAARALRQLEKFEDALKHAGQSLAIFKKGAAQGEEPAFVTDVPRAYSNIGEIHLAQNEFEPALEAHREALSIWKKLHDEDRNNISRLRELSWTLDAVGRVLDAKGEHALALEEYRKALKIDEELAKREPNSPRWQLFLAASCYGVGDMLLKENKPSEAKAPLERSERIRDKLAKQNPDNDDYQSWLAEVKGRLADCEDRNTSAGRTQAEKLLGEAVAILQTLQERTTLSDNNARKLEGYSTALAQLKERER